MSGAKIFWLCFAAIVLFALAKSGFFGGRNVNDIRFMYSAEYIENGTNKTATSWMSVNASQGYNFGPGSGWTGIACTVSGVAIPIPVQGGMLFVPLPANGFTIGARIHEVMTQQFGLPYGDDDGDWAVAWGAFKNSEDAVSRPLDFVNQMIFVPTGGNLSDARRVNANDLATFGVASLQLKLSASPQIDTTVPTIISDLLRNSSNDEQSPFARRVSGAEIVVVDAAH